jgi:FHS family Na+ dependent glucose MFS transporter 1
LLRRFFTGSFIIKYTQGISLVVFAPTLLDIAHQLNVGVGVLSVIFLVRAIGAVIGTVGSGILMDHYSRLQYAQLCIVLVGGIAATAVVPLSVHVAMLGVVMFFMGVALGGLDNGVHAILMRMWGDKSGPCMQFLHASFAFGAFIAPLVSKPFIQDIQDTDDEYNTSLVFNVSCTDDNFTDVSYCDDIASVGCVCMDAVTEACNKTSTDVINIYYNISSNASNCTVITETENFTSQFGWAYWISAMILIIPLLAFIYFAVRYDITDYCNRKKRTSQEEETTEDRDDQDLLNDDSTQESTAVVSTPTPSNTKFTLKTYKYPAFVLLFSFIFAYVGSEVSYGSLVFTYAVKGKLQFDKQTAATLTAVFWGPFAFARLFSVILALLKVRASIMMTMNVTGSVVAILILLILPHNHIAIWITSALLGASFASIFPTTMTWLSEHLPVSGKAVAVVVAGGNLGDILIPSGIAALVGNVNPESFVSCIFSLVVLSTVLIVVLFTMTFIYQRRHKPGVETMQYRVLQEAVDVSTDHEVSENGSLGSELPETGPEGQEDKNTMSIS